MTCERNVDLSRTSSEYSGSWPYVGMNCKPVVLMIREAFWTYSRAKSVHRNTMQQVPMDNIACTLRPSSFPFCTSASSSHTSWEYFAWKWRAAGVRAKSWAKNIPYEQAWYTKNEWITAFDMSPSSKASCFSRVRWTPSLL